VKVSTRNVKFLRGKYSILIAISLLTLTFMLSFGCDDESTTSVGNNPPEEPSNPSPADGSTDQNLYNELAWVATDIDDVDLTYDLYFGTTNPPELLAADLDGYIFPLYRHFNDKLDFGTTYYWKVDVTDASGEEVEGDVWSFTTTNIHLLNPGTIRTFDTYNAEKLLVDDVTVDSFHIFVADDNVGLGVYALKDTLIRWNRIDTMLFVDSMFFKTGTLIGQYSTTEFVYDVELDASGQAYLATELGLAIIDASAFPDSVTILPELGFYSTSSAAIGVDVIGSYAYITTAGGLDIIDISDPANPVSAGSVDTPGEAQDVFVAGDYAYIADADSGLQVVDISDPANPAIVGNYLDASAESAIAVHVSGDAAFVAYGEAGLVIVDISTATDPTLSSSYNTPGYAQDVYVNDIYAYVADAEDGGLQIINITSTDDPYLAGCRNKIGDGGASGVFANDSYIFLADRWNGVLVMEFQP